MKEVFENLESGVRSYCRKYPTVFKKAKNAEMYSADGTRYIDFLAVAGSMNYGHNNPEIKKAIMQYLEDDNIILKTDKLEENVSNTILKEELNKILQILSQKEKNILIHRFGLENETIKTLDEIAKIYGVSRERIRQIEKRAITKLRKYIRTHTKLNENTIHQL